MTSAERKGASGPRQSDKKASGYSHRRVMLFLAGRGSSRSANHSRPLGGKISIGNFRGYRAGRPPTKLLKVRCSFRDGPNYAGAAAKHRTGRRGGPKLTKEPPMGAILVIILLVLSLGGSGYYAHDAYGGAGCRRRSRLGSGSAARTLAPRPCMKYARLYL